MNYNDTIEYLYRQLPMFSRIGVAAYKKDLHNTIELCSSLNDPQQKFKSIHIAGTNGKGSTSHMLAAVLQEAGYKTGLYTSPHVKDFGERIRINGEMIDQDFVIRFVERTRYAVEQINPSFFELTVAMAFDYFASESVDIAVIETGLGGRLDSTNVISPLLSIITNIGYDHTNILGNSLPEIAFEKAGIIKKNTPVIIGESLPETKDIFIKKAVEMNAPVYFTAENFIAEKITSTTYSLLCSVLNEATNELKEIETDLQGLYQSKNICTVLHAVDTLNKIDFIIPETAVKSGLKQVKKITGLRGRWEVLQHDPAIIMDVAHNEDGIKQVLEQLKINYPSSHIYFILGFVNDKDVGKMLALFPAAASYYFTNAHIPRALPYENLQETAAAHHLKGMGFDNVNEAIKHAVKHAAKNDVIMICGSFFIIAEVN